MNDIQISADESQEDIHEKKRKKRKLVRLRPASSISHYLDHGCDCSCGCFSTSSNASPVWALGAVEMQAVCGWALGAVAMQALCEYTA